MKYAWIREQGEYRVRRLCHALGVSPSGYYAWRGRRPGARVQENARLLERIKDMHLQTYQAYGALRMWQALRQQGETCGRHRVERLRRAHGIGSKRRQRYLRTRSTYQRTMVAPNRLAWPFVSPGRDRVWVADITFVPTRGGWLYLAAILDMHSRHLAGWAMGARADQALASAALEMALQRRRPSKGTIHHSDQGSQYTSGAYQRQLQAAGLVASMSRKGMRYDNAVMESFFSSLKQELTHHEQFVSLDEARAKLFTYIEVFYNRQRLHSALGYRSPVEFERTDVP
ncbi:IS3 family transposase [Xanthomonas axonopodis]|uniref:IS3 family transposase n=1 Tax=Xanthomonas axonopodis TaxID=53413 RepID=UPI0035560A0F